MGTDSTCATVIDNGFGQIHHGEHRAPRGKDNEGLLRLFFIPVVPTSASIFLWVIPRRANYTAISIRACLYGKL
jgi:hypothetical protein